MSKPKFLLITDNTSHVIGDPRYIGPYRIAHELENQGIETFVIDRFYSFSDFFDILENILDENFIGIGISTTFLSPPDHLKTFDRHSSKEQRSRNYYSAGIISADSSDRKNWFTHLKSLMKTKSPRAKIFVGGSKAQYFYHSMYNDLDEIDYVVMGVVDKVFPLIIQDLLAGREPHYKKIGTKKVIDTANHYLQPKVCPPHEWKDHWFIQPGEALPIEIGRGCAFNCKFCNYDKRENHRKTLDELKQEFVRNYEKFGTQFYHFVDDCFNDSRVKVEEVCNLILSLPFKIEWVSYMRFDIAIKFPHTADLMVESGGRAFHWGVESLTYEVARRAGKGTHSDLVKKFILEFSQKYKNICYSTGSFISGLPGETEESWKTQINWLLETEAFDFVLIGPLGIAPYKAEFDGTVIDYADYSRNPQKYGFQYVDMQTGDWKHDFMDRAKATELSQWACDQWKDKTLYREGLVTDIWLYPVLRAHGLSTDEVREFYFNPSKERQTELRAKAAPLFHARRENYFQQIRALANKKSTSANQVL